VAGDPDITYDYYHSGYQVVEVRKDGDADPLKQYVWGLRYVHSPVLRWRDTSTPPDGNVDETLYYTNDANFNVTALVETEGDGRSLLGRSSVAGRRCCRGSGSRRNA